MKCLPVEKIAEGDFWTYELQLDGYRIRPSFSSQHCLLAATPSVQLDASAPAGTSGVIRDPREQITR